MGICRTARGETRAIRRPWLGWSMFVAVVFVEGKREHRSALREALLMHGRLTREKDPRCHRFDVAADPLDAASFLVYVVFDGESAYKAHQETQQFADFAILTEPWIASKRVLTYELISAKGPGSPVTPTHPGGHA